MFALAVLETDITNASLKLDLRMDFADSKRFDSALLRSKLDTHVFYLEKVEPTYEVRLKTTKLTKEEKERFNLRARIDQFLKEKYGDDPRFALIRDQAWAIIEKSGDSLEFDAEPAKEPFNILTVEVHNFNRYLYNTSTFQFSQPLTAISGETGSGKTSCFEGVCFALYGQTKRMEEDNVTIKDICQRDGYARTTFQKNDHVYEVTRGRDPSGKSIRIHFMQWSSIYSQGYPRCKRQNSCHLWHVVFCV